MLMDTDGLPSSKEFLLSVLQPHTELAKDLRAMVNSYDTGDPSHRFQIASAIVFLAGVDKTLSLAHQLLYLANKVKWKWLVKDKNKEAHELGVVKCDRGLVAKLINLQKLGLNLMDLAWIIELRNAYVHDCHLRAGYTIALSEGKNSGLVLKAAGPSVSFSGTPVVPITAEDIQAYSDELVSQLSAFLDNTPWKEGWAFLSTQLDRLPVNPEPEYSQILAGDADRMSLLLDELNARYVGTGLDKVRKEDTIA